MRKCIRSANFNSAWRKLASKNIYAQIHYLIFIWTFMRYLRLTILAIPLLLSVAFGQQDPQYTMYMFNRQALNPAYTGALEATNITLLGRSQWVGIPGAPQTATFSASGFLSGISSGIGGYIVAEELGPLQTFGANLQYAFHLQMGERSRLNIGVNGGILNKALAAKWIYNQDLGTDPTIGPPNVDVSAGGFAPDLGAGIYYHLKMPNLTGTAYPQDKFYAGVSASHLLEPKLDFLLTGTPTAPDTRLRRGFNFTTGATFALSTNIYLQPSLFVRTDLASVQSDLSANLYISPMVFGLNYRGLFYRDHDSFSGIVGFNVNTSLFIAYSYDYTISNLTSYTSGSHELIISYTFPTVIKALAPKVDVRGIPELQ